MQLMQGFSYAIVFPASVAITFQWSSLQQSETVLTILNSLNQFGPLFTMPISGLFCSSSYGWTAVYYVHVICTYAIFAVFYFLYRDHPKYHNNVSSSELSIIADGKSSNHGHKQPVP
ncbi:hypothetical protein L596_029634 [Steinernema carpocapsae]|uniref:Major facilitator superfamily (MFS) profile domain-containing protein n=1 Tax=Steinernema carpocapsae TaxID=34508 RepID=A0A4U5LV98_STECR|nr:hypothetical protein L596_029634 [Steinernema carpocapsae]